MLLWHAILTVALNSHLSKPLEVMAEEEWTKTTFRLPKSLLRSVKHYATDHDMSDTDVFNVALREYLERVGRKVTKKNVGQGD
jgi:hypothetical protein